MPPPEPEGASRSPLWGMDALAPPVPPIILVPLAIASAFFADLFAHLLRRRSMFFKRYGRRHRLTGLVFLAWLLFGFVDVAYGILPRVGLPVDARLLYDVLLGVLGTTLTLTAAYDFREAHKRVKNRASGALDEDATVTFDEMIEHAFYQGLNLAQIGYLHAAPLVGSVWGRCALCLLATAPWGVRGRFPTHSFSANYSGPQADPRTLVAVLYRAKKYQYVFYKHALLHGLNASVAVSGHAAADRGAFRLYWVCLYAAYTLEFFLQSLVKKGHMLQRRALLLNRALMLVSTAAAIQVLAADVDPLLAALSLVLNFTHRHHDCINTLLVLAVGALRARLAG